MSLTRQTIRDAIEDPEAFARLLDRELPAATLKIFDETYKFVLKRRLQLLRHPSFDLEQIDVYLITGFRSD